MQILSGIIFILKEETDKRRRHPAGLRRVCLESPPAIWYNIQKRKEAAGIGQRIYHTLEPVFDAQSRVLLLGTMPSPKSRETGFYYGHPQNRFWPVLAAVAGEPEPKGNDARRAFLLRRHIALWDVLRACVIEGADDGSIREPEPNDLSRILGGAEIRAIYTTGARAAALYKRLCLPETGRPAIPLPSTSPANCRYYTTEKLIEAYGVLTAYI